MRAPRRARPQLRPASRATGPKLDIARIAPRVVERGRGPVHGAGGGRHVLPAGQQGVRGTLGTSQAASKLLQAQLAVRDARAQRL